MTVVMLNKERVKGLTVFLETRNELGLTLIDLLKDPQTYSPEWREIYFMLTGERLETKSEKRFGKMIDDYMSGDLK